MSEELKELKLAFSKIKVWRRNGVIAPHKPLLILMSISKCLNNDVRLRPYIEIDSELKDLLKKFGENLKNFRTEYPFCRLVNDGIWELKGIDKNPAEIKRKELIEKKVSGGFKVEIYKSLKNQNAGEIIKVILGKFFHVSVHEAILKSVKIQNGELI